MHPPRPRMLLSAAALAALTVLPMPSAFAQGAQLAPREVPAKTIPVPNSVSPEIQKLIAQPLSPVYNDIPTTAEGWKAQVAAVTAATMKGVPALREALHVKSEPAVIAGVKVNILTPATMPAKNRHRLLVHVHGGCFVNGPGESGTVEAIFMAGFGHYRVISVDYRMPPDFPYPAALDDSVAVYKAATKMAKPANMAIFGSSAGGNLTLAMVLRIKQDHLRMPAAIAPGTPMSDLTLSGDSFQTNAMVDNVLVAPGANCDKRADLYMAGRDPKDPMLSPLFGDLHGFPPAILTTGTRDLLLSNTVRTHRKLRQSGVEATLQVFEAMSHSQYGRDVNAPETKEAFEEIARFFDRHLGS
ncbi:MAG TPA: alpha/beta hydrolase [Burkholderiales bacterium]|nr:alpha/beta hydrolase [Burkholderiales bacterium]